MKKKIKKVNIKLVLLLLAASIFGILLFLVLSSFSYKSYQDESLNYKLPKTWIQKGDNIFTHPLGFFEFKILKNQFGYGISQCSPDQDNRSSQVYSINGIEKPYFSSPLCLQDKTHLSEEECNRTDCGQTFIAGLCVDENGEEPTSSLGCAHLVKANADYIDYKFQLNCKKIPFLSSLSQNCEELFLDILDSISFSGGNNSSDWNTHLESSYSFEYPSEYSLYDTGDQVKLVLPNNNRFMVFRLDSTIKDLNKFLGIKTQRDGKQLTFLEIDGVEVSQLYDFIEINGERVRRDSFLFNINGPESDVLWIDSYVYELPIGNYGLVQEKILKSIKLLSR